MKHLTIFFICMFRFGLAQQHVDTIPVFPFELSSFDFERKDLNDITVLQLNIVENDTLSKEIIAQYKLNASGQIISKQEIFRKAGDEPDTCYKFYTYTYLPVIYLLDYRHQKLNTEIYTRYEIDKTSQLTQTAWYRFNEKNTTWENYFSSENRYNSAGKLIKNVEIINNKVRYVTITHTEYYKNGHIKKQRMLSKLSDREDTVKQVKLYVDSKDHSYYKYPTDSYVQGYNLIYYDKEGAISSEKYIELLENEDLKFDTICSVIKYEYDTYKRLTKHSKITLDAHGKEIGGIVNLYLYKSMLEPNFSEINDQNRLW